METFVYSAAGIDGIDLTFPQGFPRMLRIKQAGATKFSIAFHYSGLITCCGAGVLHGFTDTGGLWKEPEGRALWQEFFKKNAWKDMSTPPISIGTFPLYTRGYYAEHNTFGYYGPILELGTEISRFKNPNHGDSTIRLYQFNPNKLGHTTYDYAATPPSA